MLKFIYLLSFLTLNLFARAGGGGAFSSGGFSGGNFSGGSSLDGPSHNLLGGSEMAGMEIMFDLILLAMFILLFIWGFSANKQRVIRKGVDQTYQDKFSEELLKLKARDKNFSLSRFQKRCELPFKKIQEAWSKQDMSPTREFISDAIFERFSSQLEMRKASGIHNIIEKVQIIRSHIVGIESDAHYDTIHLSITAKAVDYTLNSQTSKIVHGTLEKGVFTEVWSFIRKPSVRTLSKPGLFEGNCPNCSAPLKLSDTLECNACGSFITSGEYDWILSEITQAHEFDEDVYTPLNYAFMQLKDKGFSKQQIEDRASVIFWKLESALMFAKVEKVRKYTLNTFLEKNRKEFMPSSSNQHHFLADASVGMVELLSIEINKKAKDRAYIFIKASGHYETRDVPGFYPPEYDKSNYKEIVHVLERNTDVQTSSKFGLSSYRCTSCGAPLILSESARCRYCSKSQNDGSLNWVLAEVMPLSMYAHPPNKNALKKRTQHYDNQRSYSHQEELLILLIQVMNIDKKQENKELEYLNIMAEKQGISKQRLNTLTARYLSPSYATKLDGLDLDTQEKIETFFIQLVQMSLIDGKVSSKEIKLLKTIASKLNFPFTKIRKIIKEQDTKMYKKFSKQKNLDSKNKT